MASSEFRTYEPTQKKNKDQTYKLKFNPKKKCSRCEQLNVFSCEHVVVVRDSMQTSFTERGKYYNHPRLKDSKDVSKSIDATNDISHQDDFDLKNSDRKAQLIRERLEKFGKPQALINNNNNNNKNDNNNKQVLPPLKDAENEKPKKKSFFGKS